MSKWNITGGVKYTCYDFGGQEVFYPTHEFFLSGKAVFVLVFNVMNEDHTRVNYWLKKIRTLSKPDIPVVALVGTRYDELLLQPAPIQQRILRQIDQLTQNCQMSHGFSAPFFRVSCTSGEGVPEL